MPDGTDTDTLQLDAHLTSIIQASSIQLYPPNFTSGLNLNSISINNNFGLW